jgi:tRNA-specific 2-thiouridylase
MSEDRVVVAMSGGVDSSVAAAFLREKGYDVIGLTMKFWGKNNRCCSDDDIKDARRVAQHLGIPHYIVSLEESFRKKVVDYFVSEYTRGRTPNPCAVCNPAIKFSELLRKADELNARFLATGHYAIKTYDSNRERFILRRGKERGKDQSYFLARLSQESLSRSLFPVGSFTKEKIRKLADRFCLPVSEKTESQEVCFIPDGNVAGFIEKQGGKQLSSGPIINSTGQILGTHRGIVGYTIGQRKGLGIAVGKPIYVTKINAETNTVFVGEPEELYRNYFIASDPHWISVKNVTEPIRAKVRIRYKHRPQWAGVTPFVNGKVAVEFDRPQRAITPGQLAVFYAKDIVVGSAWIDQVLN